MIAAHRGGGDNNPVNTMLAFREAVKNYQVGMGTAAKFILTQFLGVNIFDDGNFACLQIPISYDVGITLELDKKTIINRAHRRNIAVQYWTINGPDEMRMLIELGSDCIMTDKPELLRSILEEYK